MKPAALLVWRRCASHWRACCSGVTRLSSAAPRASMSLCSRAVNLPSGAPLPGLLCTAAVTSHPSRTLCAFGGSTFCWSCQSVVSSFRLFCPSCRSIQPPNESQDFFQLLDCERSFNIDVQDLQRKYRNLQRLLHPDYYSQKSKHERAISERQSSLVNKAYNTLLSPLQRGIYLLSLHGITIADGTEGGADAPFLFEILEINEKLNDLSTEVEIEEVGTFIQDMCQALTENVRKAFEKGDLDGAKMFLVKMKYYSNILDQVKKKMVP
ncbi:iron-sulfur cluster co-chaperone protein HscB [Bufo bufo]|uniref:iron-sulfur cluster co-chaperone protein HscB n=1 Tax=Bufo bufo TaxID=8384 RepID=UPI001ABE8C8F|nr:iron-sulfur cluster co-chaperone protein HscB [Bufo bufo]